ncbi:MAG: Trehalose-6-phosphate synthase [Phycisphaerae bacterium]|nr:Trehalose-6-phosphate synthase [Phycisphaerae bacterium]
MRIIIASNRLPIVLERDSSGLQMRPGTGGLITALRPIMRRCGGIWVGWSGAVDIDAQDLQPLLQQFGQDEGYTLVHVPLTAQERDLFYAGFSNEIIWPLFHDLQSLCNFNPDYWVSYLAVKHKFAEMVESCSHPDDFIWVHDYHLLGMGRRLRQHNIRNRIGFFLHIPFPPPDIFCKLPWRIDVLTGLLKYDLIGFQTPRDSENFLDCLRKLLPDVRRKQHPGGMTLHHADGATRMGAFPIGIDYQDFAEEAATATISQRVRQLRQEMPNQQIILGIDRLDHTKGIPYRLRAFEQFLRKFPDLHKQVTMLQVVIPSRQGISEYIDLKAQIEQLVSQINGQFTLPGWVPIHHVFRSLNREELLTYYRVADVGLVTPLKDGMNLVAKEYCACQAECDGVLILSEFAGAAHQLHHDAIMVNPYDIDRVALMINQAVRMSRKQRRPCMRRLRRLIQRQDIYWWLNEFMDACGRVQPAPVVGGEDP